MGGGSSKPINLTTSVVCKRLEECRIPDERDSIFDFIEMLQRKLVFPGALKAVSDEFKASEGVQIVLKIVKRMIKDDVCVSLVVGLFEIMKARINVVMDFIQFGGLDIINRVLEEHRKNDILLSEVNRLLKGILIVGAQAATKEIKNETMNLALCMNCQQALARAKRFDVNAPTVEAKLPRPSERVARVLSFMANYIDRIDVLCTGMDALISFANNADAKHTINETSIVEVVGKCLGMHPQNFEIMWRGCLVLSTVAHFSKEVAADVAKVEQHSTIATNYDVFESEPRVQQQIMWYYGALLVWDGMSSRKIQQSQACLDLFRRLIQTRATLVKKILVEDKFKPYKVVIPLSVRRFMRESGGELLPEDAPVQQAPRKFAKRRNFDELPNFGTTHEMFNEGESGLIEEKKDDGPRDWEEKLTYGKAKVKPKKKH